MQVHGFYLNVAQLNLDQPQTQFRLSIGVYVVKKFIKDVSHTGDFHACVALKFMPNAAVVRYHETFASFFRPCPGTAMSN